MSTAAACANPGSFKAGGDPELETEALIEMMVDFTGGGQGHDGFGDGGDPGLQSWSFLLFCAPRRRIYTKNAITPQRKTFVCLFLIIQGFLTSYLCSG